MSQALYRKYRSRGFDEVVGQRHVTDLLRNAIKNGTISHAYLFTGPRGTGKTSVARILAHLINDLPYSDDATHLDIIEIDAASNRRIDDIRDLREKVHIAPTSAKYKVYIIDEVHMLTGESFNALLKTLEEPPSHVIFILATTELHKVPATIVSRTQRFHFRPGSIGDVSAHLRMIADKEHIAIDDEALELIAEHSDGGFRDSVSLLDQVSTLDEGTVTVELVEHLLGLAPRHQIERMVELIAAGQSEQSIKQLQQLFDDGMSPIVIVSQLIKTLSERAVHNPELYSLLYELIEVPKSFAPQLKLLATIGRFNFHSIRSEPQLSDLGTSPKQPPVMAQAVPGKVKTPPSPNASQASSVVPASQAQSSKSIDISWPDVLEQLHERAPALHSIAKRADATITPDEITLNFVFALHRKKFQDEKNLHQLSGIITDLYGSCPPITVREARPKLDATSAAVADIMGGGIPVQVPTEGKS